MPKKRTDWDLERLTYLEKDTDIDEDFDDFIDDESDNPNCSSETEESDLNEETEELLNGSLKVLNEKTKERFRNRISPDSIDFSLSHQRELGETVISFGHNFGEYLKLNRIPANLVDKFFEYADRNIFNNLDDKKVINRVLKWEEHFNPMMKTRYTENLVESVKNLKVSRVSIKEMKEK